MRWTKLDGGMMGFDRASGLNVIYAGDRTRTIERDAPRSLQVGLLTPCNLACSFCYRDTKAPSLLSREFLIDLLQQADRWGVLEVAFGGGEPLLWKGFAEMVEELHRTTALGLNVTTNGLLLTAELMAKLRGHIAEFRLSAYPDNDWRGTLARFRDDPIGINWIVTPHNVRDVAPRVRECLALGARNVLLLGYKGSDQDMLLDAASLDLLRAALRELDGAPLMLDICLYPRLADLPHLFARTDCGAGDDMLAITADRAVAACSFADRRIPFASFTELVQIYRLLRAAKPHANTPGCTREQFSGASARRVVSGRILPVLATDHTPQLWAWRAHASSNSGTYTLLARFRTVEAAKRLEAELDDAYQGHLDWIIDHQPEFSANYYAPTPPLRELATRHGFTWPHDNGFAWEGDASSDRADADLLDIERFGSNVIVHIAYGQNIGDVAIEHLCAELGAESVVPVEQPFRILVRPNTPSAEAALAAALDAESEEWKASYIAFDSAGAQDGPIDECKYRVEIELAAGARRIGFAANIGGYGLAAKLVLALAGVKNVAFELHGGHPPRRVDDPRGLEP